MFFGTGDLLYWDYTNSPATTKEAYIMPTIESIAIKGFKSIRDVEVELRDVNVLIGANGAGKSNFIEVLAFLQEIQQGNLQRYVKRAGGADRLLHFGSKTTETIEIDIRFQSPSESFGIDLLATDADSLEVVARVAASVGAASAGRGNESPTSHSPGHSPVNGGQSYGVNERLFSGFDEQVRKIVDTWRIYHFHDTSRSAPMKKTAKLHDNRYLRPDGSNLAAFLYLLREKHEFEYGFIQKTVRMVAPFFDEFVLEPMALNPDTIRLEWKHKGTDAYFDASSLSDGTLRFIALATLLQQPKELRPSVILLDEPELGMHPLGITLLAAMVNSASVDTQVILATQSPMLLDYFEPEEVVVADRVDGGTQFTRFTSEELAVWLKRYSIGELWEMNDLGGRPAPERLSHQR